MSFSNEIDQKKMEKNNAESANLFLFLNYLLSYGSRISEFRIWMLIEQNLTIKDLDDTNLHVHLDLKLF